MKFGVHIFPTEHSIQPDELARAAEERRLDSVWFSEHTHIPVRSLHPPGRPAPLAPHYWQTYDSIAAMTQAAAATQSIRVATGVLLVIEHDPIILAKAAATVDRLSGGRLILGVGAGWLDTEMADHGVAYRTRFQLLREQLLAIKEIWTKEEAEFHGKFVSFDPMRCEPKPLQKPHPPIIMGGEGDKAIQLAAELCDGWAPWLPEWPRAQERINQFRHAAEANGRDPDSLEISVFERSVPDAGHIADLESAGVRRIILTVLGQGRDEVLPALDRLAGLVP